MPKTVLFISYHFPPSAASGTHRILGFAEHLPHCGWDVVVLAPPTMPWEPVDPGLLARVPAETQVQYVNYPSGRLFWPLRKMDPYLAWLIRARGSLQRLMAAHRPDVVVTSGPPHCVHLAGMYAQWKYGARWLADFRDPWVTGDFLPARKAWYEPLARKAEPRVFHAADGIIVNAPNAGKVLAESFPQYSNKIHCVSNGYDPQQFQSLQHAPSSKVVITHTGQMYAGRDPRPFFAAIEQLIAGDPQLGERLLVQLIGTQTEGAFDVRSEIAKRGLSEVVHIVDQVSYQESLERMVNSDILLLIDTPTRTLGVPAKLYEYIGADRPILALASPNSDVHWVLQEARVPYRLALTDDANAIRNALAELLDGRARMPVDGNGLAFSRRVLAEKLSHIMNTLVLPVRTHSNNKTDRCVTHLGS